MTNINRRTVLKGAAWSIPVVAVAVATPLAAASGEPTETEKSVIRFTNTSVYSAGSNEVGWNTKIQVDGPVPVTSVFLKVTLKRGGQVVATREFTFPFISGHGNSGIVEGPFSGLAKGDGSPFTVEFYAVAANASYIAAVGNQSVTPHGGWK